MNGRMVVIDEDRLAGLIADVVGRQVAGLREAVAAAAKPVEREPDDLAMLTTSQVCALFQVDRRTLHRMELLGEIPSAIRRGERFVRWRRSVIAKWMRESTAAAGKTLSIAERVGSMSRVKQTSGSGATT